MMEVAYLDVNTARLMANVLERSLRLFEDGYEAEVICEKQVRVKNPKGTVYMLDVQDCTCCCGFFTGHEGRLPCKHLLGWEKLLEDQAEAKPDDPFGGECRFPLGRLLMTPGVQEALHRTGQSPIALLLRHSQGDWGEVAEEDRAANERALRDGSRLLSSYRLADDTTIWIVTEADRSATVLLLPEEY
jgi:hypothetical protein